MVHPDPNQHVAARPLAARAGSVVIGQGTQIGARKPAAMPKHMQMCMCLGMPVAGSRRKGHLQR